MRRDFRVVRRQYVIANCLNKKFYSELIKAIKSVGQADYVFDPELLSTKQSNRINISVKDFQMKKGLSTCFFDPSKKNHDY